ncbi:MAG TPA: 16S rRNA (adenine(1518)-N(6)/adenine(1519)-N(6))-dimethyltransferase RsmA [Nitrospiraceae bacterium]|nr:16S rRNA (adenine(1518)-N(6)/adenine(1519)-N(6))-dimethyltransferase RsmA [Nitrospiraceae bacterium]
MLPRPLKQLGQHFLVDANIVRKIVTLADLQGRETVFEIGPGRGILTRALCGVSSRVIAVEIDRQLYEHLRDHTRDCANLELHHGDALAFPLSSLPKETVVVANLPYYLSTALLFRLLDHRDRFSRLVLMLQTEVARRLIAGPGSKDYGVLSVLTQVAAEAELAFDVSAHCFRPRPEVGSSVVKLCITRPGPIPPAQEKMFRLVVRASFAHRRKRLLNSLRDEGFAPAAVQGALARLRRSSDCRAEELSLEEFVQLAGALAPTSESRVVHEDHRPLE